MVTDEQCSRRKERGYSSMPLPHVTSVCWCMDLETGATMIGVLHLMISILLIIVTSYFAELNRSYIGTVEDTDGIYGKCYTIAVVVATGTVVHLLLAATLLFGVAKRSTLCVSTWVRVMCVLCIAALLYVAVAACLGLTHSGADMFVPLAEGVLFFGILAYCIVCVNSYYLYIRSLEEDNPKTTV